MPTSKICDLEPFRYQATPQPQAEEGASGGQINEQSLEDYLNRLRDAICDDITSIIEECCDGGGGASAFLGLTDTPASYATKSGQVATVNGAEDALVFSAAPADSDGLVLNYSTSEQATNRTWLLGETIYQKTINFGALPNSATKSVAHGIANLQEIIAHQAWAYDSAAGNRIVLPHIGGSNPASVLLSVDNTNINLTTGTNRSTYNAYVTLFYIKV